MATPGNAAYQLDLYTEERHASRRYDLSVMEGGGRETRARRDATPLLVTLARLAVVFVVLTAVLGGVRVTINALTVDCLSDVSAVNTSVSSARMTHTELEAQRSQLLSSDRIRDIATGRLGMTFATSVETITVRDENLPEVSADDAQLAHDAEGTAGDA